jgi:ribosomal protein S18 acetylase RimI-like enzyme
MVRVRPPRLADAEEVVRVHVRTWQSAYAGMVPDDVLNALDGQLEDRVRRTRERWSEPEPRRWRTLLAVDPADDRPVGFTTFGPYRLNDGSEDVDPTIGEVLAIYVDPAHQRRGAGRALMDAAVAALRADGVREIRLWVLAENAPSRRFYERYGYRLDGAREPFRVQRPDGTAVDLPEVRYMLPVP